MSRRRAAARTIRATTGFLWWAALSLAGCGSDPPYFYEGPMCDALQERRWTLAPSPALDASPMWALDPELEAYLEGYGMHMSGTWAPFSGNDFFEAPVPMSLSPRAKMLSAYELIATSFEGWETFNPRHPLHDFEYYDTALKWFAGFVHQKTYRIDMVCGDHPDGKRATTWWERGPRPDKATIMYPPAMEWDTVRRAALVVHEVYHAATRIKHVQGSKDREFMRGGAWTAEALYHAAIFYAPEHPRVTMLHRMRAQTAFHRIVPRLFVEPTEYKLSDFAAINERPEDFLRAAGLI